MDKTKKNKMRDEKANSVFSSEFPLSEEMTDTDVEEQFCTLLDDMNLSLDKRGPLLSKSITEKRLLIAQTHNSIDNSPSKYVEILKDILDRKYSNEKVVSKLDSLRIYLSNSPLSMVKEFNNQKNQGLERLIGVMSLYVDLTDISIMCLRCLRAFGNFGYGLLTLISSKETLLHVALCLNPQYSGLMLLAVELLTLFTFYSFESHSNVMEVLYTASRIHNYEERFMPIVDGLKAGLIDGQTNLVLPCLQFINVIVNPNFKDGSVCSNLDSNYSMHLRIEFVRCRLNGVFDLLLSRSPSKAVEQNIAVFQSDNDYEDDYINKIDLVKTSLKDRDEVYQMLSRTMSDTDCDGYLTSVLKHLLIIKDNPLKRHLYRLIDEVVAELIFHSDGMCPDPALNQLDSYNLTELFEKFCDPSNNCVSAYQDKLDKVVEEKHEAEAKLSSLANKLGVDGGIGAPPPPPPPPGIAAPPPPPPPGFAPPPSKGALANNTDQALPFGMHIKVPLKPKGAMKKANWSKVETKLLDKNCIWKQINDDDMHINDALKELGERFCTKAPKTKDQLDDSSSVGSNSSLQRKVKEFKVLDAKSGQNLAILSASLKVPHQEIKRRILEMNEGLLSQSNVENLLKNLPPVEQLTMLSKMNEDYENLNEAEQFGCTLASIKRLDCRLGSLLFKMKFSERISEIKPSVICATEALSEVRKSASLPKLLELVLQFGNFMNNSSASSLTVGFHLSFLTKLTDTKDNISELTLMQFLVGQVKSRFPELLNIVGELSYLDRASRISAESINSTISEMKSVKSNLDRELKSYKKQAENDNYSEVMDPFLVTVSEQLNLITEMNSKLHQSYKDMARYFSFDLVKYPIEEFFHDIKQFKDDFHKSIADIEAIEQLEMKRQKSKEEKEKRENDKVERDQRLKKATREEDDGVLDNLLETLNSGDAYGNRGQNRNRRKKVEKLHVFNRSRSRKDFDKDLIPY